MPKQPRVSGDETIRALERLGFARTRQTGSHVMLKKVTETGVVGTTVPLHRELKPGTLHSILKLAKVSLDEFIAAL